MLTDTVISLPTSKIQFCYHKKIGSIIGKIAKMVCSLAVSFFSGSEHRRTSYEQLRKRIQYVNSLWLLLATDETYTDAELARVSVLTLDVMKTAYVSPVASVWQVS